MRPRRYQVQIKARPSQNEKPSNPFRGQDFSSTSWLHACIALKHEQEGITPCQALCMQKKKTTQRLFVQTLSQVQNDI